MEDFNFVLRQNEENGKAWYNLGIIRYKQNKTALARDAWEKAATHGHKGGKIMLKKYFK